jgi:hypothetical protein
MGKGETAEKVVNEIRRRTRRPFSAEERIRIVLVGLRGEESTAQFSGSCVGCRSGGRGGREHPFVAEPGARFVGARGRSSTVATPSKGTLPFR